MSARPLDKITDFSISKSASDKGGHDKLASESVDGLAKNKAVHAAKEHKPAKEHGHDGNSEKQKHLPKLELVDTKALQAKLLDHKGKPEERLEAAHKLYKADHKQFAEKREGKTRYYQIVEKPVEKDKEKLTRVAVVEVENKTARLYLDGTVDKDGKYEMASNKEAKSNHERTDRSAAAGSDKSSDKRSDATSDERSGARSSASRSERASASSGERAGGQASDRSSNRSSDGSDYGYSGYAGESRGENSVRQQRAERSDSYTKVSRAEANELFKEGQNAPVDKLTKLPNGCVYLRSKLAVDADGGKDWRSDPYGQPTTSLTNSDGSALDAGEVFYFVLPMTDEYENLGIKLGDLAWVRNAKTGKMVPAIFGDRGPKGKIGEGSQALCRALGLSGDPRTGGTSQKDIEFLIIPGSGTGKGDISKSATAMADRLQSTTVASSAGNGGDSPLANKIVACARDVEGDKLWTDYSEATRNGRLGCAISTSKVLRSAGLDIPKITGAAALVDTLEDKGWKKVDVSRAKPGDVIYGEKPGTNAHKGGGNAHVGIVEGYDSGSKKLMVYANVSRTGKWTNSTSSSAFSSRSFGDNVWAFTPPSA